MSEQIIATDRFVVIGKNCYERAYPWITALEQAKRRCSRNHKDPRTLRNYAAKGIVCFLKSYEIEELWFRDKAYLLKKPSLDRVNPMDDYRFENCRFIEQSENSRRVQRATKNQK